MPTVEDSSEVQHLIAASESQPRSHLDDIEGYSKHITSMLVDPDRDYRFRWEQQVPLVRGEVNGVSLECVPDTGSYGPALYLDSVAALRCGVYLPSFGRRRLEQGARGNDWSVPAFADDASFGPVEIVGGGRVEIIAPLGQALLEFDDTLAPSDALVGIGMLTTHWLFAEPTEWDLPRRTIRLLNGEAVDESGGQWLSVPTRWEPIALRVWVTCHTPAGDFELLLDSGSPISILPESALAGAGELDPTSGFVQATPEDRTATVIQRASVDVLGLGPIDLFDLDVGLSNGAPGSPDPTLSLWGLRSHRLRINAEARTIEVWVPAIPPAPASSR